MKPFSPACERNQGPILAALQPLLADRRSVLEIGSGTGQHAVYFASQLPKIVWQTSDQAEHLAGIRLWLEEAQLPNLPMPLSLNVSQPDWPAPLFDTVFTANSLQIMRDEDARNFFAGVQTLLPANGLLVIYGPFNAQGRFTSEGNASLDAWIKRTYPGGGIKDLEVILELARNHGLILQNTIEMPANNRLLHWLKSPASPVQPLAV